MKIDKIEIDKIVSRALKEDIGSGDITSTLIISRDKTAKAFLLSKEEGVIAGLQVAKYVFRKLDKNIRWRNLVKEGEFVSAGTKIALVEGHYRALLTGERTALNFLQRMSGIASITLKYVEQLYGLKTKILDTRKTVPGLRLLDKYSVYKGTGTNHRIGLYDMVMIKDNHIKAAGGISKAVTHITKKLNNKIKIEVETTTLKEVKEALNSEVNIIMLDNMSIKQMKEAVKMINGKAKVEASGGVDINSVRKIANTGVDYISVGALTHSVKALDIAMYFQ
jgi:nicotinate-nucleotide pyrophosphorylase (carboxylating)